MENNTHESCEVDDKDTSNENFTNTMDPSSAALYLAGTYNNLLIERDNILSWLNGQKPFTKEMAIEELLSVTAATDKEAVQTGSISDQTAMIAVKLAAGYVEKRQKQLEQEAGRMVEHLGYVQWKIGVIEDAMQTRMTKSEAVFFKLMFVKKKTYNQLRKAHRGSQIYDHDISSMKKSVLLAVSDELLLRNCGDYIQRRYLRELENEMKNADEMKSADETKKCR